MSEPNDVFDEQALLAEARRTTGLDDFGDDRFREPLRRMLDSLSREARLSETGRATQRARILGNLTTRLCAEAFLERHPEILDERIAAPLVIVGPSRSGTTRLHRLLSEDPRHYAVLWWENRSPIPYVDSDWRNDDPRIVDAREEVRVVLETVPELASIHPWDAEGPDEDALLMEHAFVSHVPESGLHVPSYRSWLDEQDWTAGYEYLARMLQILQWQKKERGEIGDRWVLKTPQHLRYLEPICSVFPGARVIQTHRDPLTTVPSMASLYSSLWDLASDEVDRIEVGRQVRERLGLGLNDCLAFRDRSPERFCDVWFDDMQVDSIGQLERIYAWLGVDFSPEARRRVETWLVENARDKRPPHHYTLDQFGYTEESLAEQFADYRERFILHRPA